MRRLLVIADMFYPDIVGGSSIVAHHINKCLIKDGYSIDVVTRSFKALEKKEKIFGHRVFRINVSRNPISYLIIVIKMTILFRHLLSENKYSLIIAHHANMGLISVILSKIYKIHFVYYFHGPWHKEDEFIKRSNNRFELFNKSEVFIKLLMEYYIIKKSNYIICLSNYMKNEINNIWSGNKNIKIIPGGVETKIYHPTNKKNYIKRRYGLSPNKYYVLTIRRLENRMGLENLVRAFSIIEDENIYLLIGGDGTLKNALMILVDQLGVSDKVKFLGFIPDYEIADYYRLADLFVMPSLALEGFGLSTIESLACGTPVIGSNNGGTPEILRGLDPHLIMDNSYPETIAEKITFIKNDVRYKGTNKDISLYALKYDWAKIYDQIKPILIANMI